MAKLFYFYGNYSLCMIQFTCKPFYDLSLDELYDILSLRQAVFVVEQDCVYLDADYKDQKSWHFAGRDEKGRLVAYARILPKGEVYDDYLAIGRITTTSTGRGKGIGKQLVKASIEWIEHHLAGQSVKISAQSYLIRFYETFGFTVYGKEYLEDGIPHIAMILDTP